MKQKLIALVLAFTVWGTVTVFGVENNRLFTSMHYYTATLYYCDSDQSRVVLKHVDPVGRSDMEKRRTALEATYREIPISGSGQLQDGTFLPLSELNQYTDCRVGVVIARNNAEGIRVLAMRFL